MDGALGWLKRVAPVVIPTEERERIWNQEAELLDLVKKAKDTTHTPCKLEPHILTKILIFIAQAMGTGKMKFAADAAHIISNSCFDEGNPENPKDPMNPYRLLLKSFANIADCEVSFYDLNILKCSPIDVSLKARYALCQQTSFGILEMDPTVFKIPEMLTMCEELARFACIRQCHVNLLKNLGEIDPDESVDWYDRIKVLDSNVVALINESDIAVRLCTTEQEQKEFQMYLQTIELDKVKPSDQYCTSWYYELHLREICSRAQAAMDVLKLDPAYIKFCSKHEFMLAESKKKVKPPPKEPVKNNRRRFLTQNIMSDTEETAKRMSLGDNFELKADNIISFKRSSSTQGRRKEVIESTHSVDDGKSFTEWNAAIIKEKNRQRKERAKLFQALGADEVLPEIVRRKVRMILRKLIARGREIQADEVEDDEIMNLAFPVSDDDASDEENAKKAFVKIENPDDLQRKKMRKFGLLNPTSKTKPILWYQNAKDELFTIHAIENHCVKLTGGSTEPFATMEQYLGTSDETGNFQNYMLESNRNIKCRAFNLQKEAVTDDGALLFMPSSNAFKDFEVPEREASESIGLESLFLQNLRKRCIDELLILMIIIKGQQQLQDGNFIRCLAYLRLLLFKLRIFKGKRSTEETQKTNLYSFLMHLYMLLIDKYRLYATETLGCDCLPDELKELMRREGRSLDLRDKCLQFCKSTRSYYFAICIRGRLVTLDPEETSDGYGKITYPAVCEQLDHFFSMDNFNKNNHMNAFFRSECMPIMTGLVYLHKPHLMDKINYMSRKNAIAELSSLKGLSTVTKEWIRKNSGYGITKDMTSGDRNDDEENGEKVVPFLFQMPASIYLCRTNETVVKQNVRDIRLAISDFVQEKYDDWKKRCETGEQDFRKVNRDRGYDEDRDLSFFGESIEKDVYMVAAYSKQPNDKESERIVSEMNKLCRSIRSQTGFSMLQKFNTKEEN